MCLCLVLFYSLCSAHYLTTAYSIALKTAFTLYLIAKTFKTKILNNINKLHSNFWRCFNIIFRSFIILITFIITKLTISIIPFKSLISLTFVFMFSFVLFPMFCSLFNNSLFYSFKNGYKNTVKTGIIISVLLEAIGIALMLPFSITLKYKNFIILAPLAASLGATLWLLILTNFAYTPIFKENKPADRIVMSFKMAKKNYYKTFVITIKTYILFILIIPIPWAITKYIKTIKQIYKKYGGDDGVRTHDLLNAIQTRSQLRHAPKQ